MKLECWVDTHCMNPSLKSRSPQDHNRHTVKTSSWQSNNFCTKIQAVDNPNSVKGTLKYDLEDILISSALKFRKFWDNAKNVIGSICVPFIFLPSFFIPLKKYPIHSAREYIALW